MKEYAYFPGCSLEKMAVSYHLSALETTKKLGIKLKELDDWNCCGATTYFYIDELLAYTLCARNLAIAEKTGLDVVAPCSACYKNMYFTAAHLKKDTDLAEHVNFA
ncbi:MAG: disulfide reductase, partial [Chloroflexi bacterium]|nr:disulfide reductase [Chloroflexota bacterium]